MKENNFIVRWLAHKSSAVFYKSRQMAGSEPRLMGARCGPCAWWEGPGLAAVEAGRSAGSVQVCGCGRREVWWRRARGRADTLPYPLAHSTWASLTWWDADPGGPRTAPLQAALHLTGLICLLNMETTSSPPRPRAALRPVGLTLDVRPGGEICQAASHLHYSSWLFNRTGFTCTAAWLWVCLFGLPCFKFACSESGSFSFCFNTVTKKYYLHFLV